MSEANTPVVIRIAVVDDHPMLREGIVQTLRREPDFEIVGEGQSASDAIEIAERDLPDVMLIDINMPGSGLNALRQITESCPAIATLVITVREDEETVTEALRIGARGYALKGIGGNELVRTIRSIHQGDSFITTSLASRILEIKDRANVDATTAIRRQTLTIREDQILRLIAKGRSNKEIGSELALSEKTVKHYVTNILQKLHVRNRVEAALVAQTVVKQPPDPTGPQ